MFALLTMTLVAIGCSDNGVEVPPEIPVSRLLAAPETIPVQGRLLSLSTILWRDFQPNSPPDGKPLISIIIVAAADTAQLPTSISIDAVWIVCNNQVWSSWFTNEPIAHDLLKPNRIVKIARQGPKWGPNVGVDVIVRVNVGVGAALLLRAHNQWIDRTE
jgi:hypothetical protein